MEKTLSVVNRELLVVSICLDRSVMWRYIEPMLDKNDLVQITEIVRQVVEHELKPVKKSLSNLEADSRKMRRDINTIVSALDNDYLDLRQRVERIEEKVGLAA